MPLILATSEAEIKSIDKRKSEKKKKGGLPFEAKPGK
jgi:hypothetical protein